MSSLLCFEDFVVNATVAVGSHTFTAGEIIEFAQRYDAQPIHTDSDAAAASPFGGLIASGWHTCAVMMGMLVRNCMGGASSLGSPGVEEIRWLKPVRPGDTLSMTLTTTSTRVSASKPDRGIIGMRWEGSNQHGEPVVVVRASVLFARRIA